MKSFKCFCCGTREGKSFPTIFPGKRICKTCAKAARKGSKSVKGRKSYGEA